MWPGSQFCLTRWRNWGWCSQQPWLRDRGVPPRAGSSICRGDAVGVQAGRVVGRRGPSGGGPEKRAPCHGAAAARETGGGMGQFPHLRRQVGSRVSAGTRVREEGGPGHQTRSLGGNRRGAWPSFPGKGRGENDRDCDRGTGVSPGCCRREHGRWLRSVVEPSALRRRAADGLPPESPPHPRRPLTAPG